VSQKVSAELDSLEERLCLVIGQNLPVGSFVAGSLWLSSPAQ
jgi:hypothetical protein